MVSITQQPGAIGYSYGPKVYIVESTLVGPGIDPANLPREYSFVVDIYEGTTRVQRLFKQPNPIGVGVFDLQSIFNNRLQYDIEGLGATSNILSTNATKTFSVRFGERYADSAGTLNIFDGSGANIGDPDIRANDILVIKGVTEPNGIDLSDSETLPSVLSFNGVRNLNVRSDDMITVSTYESGTNSITHRPVTIQTGTFTEEFGGETFTFTQVPASSLGDVRFAWFNSKGGIDYFTATKGMTTNTSVSKSTYQSTPVEYGRSTSSIRERTNSSVYRAGEVTYGVQYNQTYRAVFDWTTQAESQFLEGLFDSPAVFVQEGTNFVPIIVTSNYDRYPIERNQRNFNYTVEYRYANGKPNL